MIVSKKKATGTKTAAGSRSMKRNLDTGVEVCDNRVKKNQRHTTNQKPNMYKDIYNNWFLVCCVALVLLHSVINI